MQVLSKVLLHSFHLLAYIVRLGEHLFVAYLLQNGFL